VLACLGVCNISTAQEWKRLTDKVKDVKGKVDSNNPVTNLSNKVDEVKNQGDSNNPVNGNSTSSTESTAGDENRSSGILSGGIEDFLQEKYSLIKASETNLNLYTLKEGDCDPQKHNAGAKKLDYANTVAKLKSEGKLLSTDRKYGEVMKYGSEYLDIYKEVIKPYVNKTIEEAYSNKKFNQNQAIEMAHNAQLVAEAAMLILYDNADAKQLKADADKALNDIGGEYYSKLYVSDFHKNNVGKILFSTRPIIPGNEDPSQFVTSVSGTDKVYAIAYFNARIKDLDDMISYKISIDGNENTTPQFTPNTSDLEHSYYLVEIIPDPKVAVHQFDPVEFGKVLSTLSPRKHVMDFGFVFGYGENSASGTLNLEWSNADGAAILANSEMALKNAKDNKAKNMQLPDYFYKPSKSFSDPNLTIEKIKAAIMADGDYAENIKQISKIVIGDKYFESGSDWNINKNELGIPTHKSCNRAIYILFTGKDGWCYFSDEIVFRKDYSGAGTYENTRLVGFKSGTYTRIACENVGKK
jgi:hypothetical protein